jgi:hypothetical protein
VGEVSGTAKVKPPQTDEEWARNTQRRIEQVEHPASTRIGAWVLSTNPDTGDLIASHVEGGAVRLASPPTGEAADSVAIEWSNMKVERRTPQTGSGYVPVQWDTIVTSTSDWSVSEGSTEVAVPSDGMWLVKYHLQVEGSQYTIHKARLDIDGVPAMAARHNTYFENPFEPSLYMSEIFPLSAGALIVCNAWEQGNASVTFGSSSNDPSICTSLSLTRLPIG